MPTLNKIYVWKKNITLYFKRKNTLLIIIMASLYIYEL